MLEVAEPVSEELSQSVINKVVVTGLRGMPGVMGGVESHCEELLPRLRELDPSLEIVVAGRRPYLASRDEQYRGIRVVGLPSPRKQSLEALVSTAIGIAFARGHGAKMVHIHAIGPALLAPLARLLGMRVIMTHHGADYDRAKWGRFARIMLKLGERLGIAAADQVILVSPSLRERLAARWPDMAAKMHYVPNGATAFPDDGTDREHALQSLGLEKDGYVLTVARLVPEKGVDYLIRSFLASSRPGKLVVAGAADHASEYSRSVLEQASDRVILLGAQSRATLRHLYGGASLFVLPSFHEGLPIAALEAASFGVPMLLSDIDGNKDLGLPDSCYFSVGDEAALTDALGKPDDIFRIDSSRLGERFDWDSIAQQTSVVYRRAIEGPAPDSRPA